MICCLLMETKLKKSAADALEFYGQRRTENGKGVTIPSQIRYVAYFDAYRKSQRFYTKKSIKINEVNMYRMPSIMGN